MNSRNLIIFIFICTPYLNAMETKPSNDKEKRPNRLTSKKVGLYHPQGKKFQEGLLYILEKNHLVDNGHILPQGCEIQVKVWLTLINDAKKINEKNFEEFMLATFHFLRESSLIFSYLKDGKHTIGIDPQLIVFWETFAKKHTNLKNYTNAEECIQKKAAFEVYKSCLNNLESSIQIEALKNASQADQESSGSAYAPLTFYTPINNLKLSSEVEHACGNNFMLGLSYGLWFLRLINKKNDIITEPAQNMVLEALTYLPHEVSQAEKKGMVDLLIEQRVRFEKSYTKQSPLPPIVQDLIKACTTKPSQEPSYMQLVETLQTLYKHRHSDGDEHTADKPKFSFFSLARSKSSYN